MESRGFLAKLNNGRLQGNDVAWVQLAVKISLCVHDGKRHVPPLDFFWVKTQANRR